ncbi:hypothetical protein UFOVP541_20 [uncultured Caudovirales phage]|uniref:Uncharacterized protein n=1 Tax=uncultured Caudovirales phage TaxID=2100421 RepID=A0A6J5MRD9_9CAUD|nr:hypothetical protein UFOVP541_20 [uncultured Caudovirales phage]
MARFCQAFNLSPSEYKALTMAEFAAFLKVLEDGNDT